MESLKSLVSVKSTERRRLQPLPGNSRKSVASALPPIQPSLGAPHLPSLGRAEHNSPLPPIAQSELSEQNKTNNNLAHIAREPIIEATRPTEAKALHAQANASLFQTTATTSSDQLATAAPRPQTRTDHNDKEVSTNYN